METATARPKLDLSPFCDPHGERYSLKKPFLSGGDFVYATDGRILVRTTLDVCPADLPTGKVPNNPHEIVEPIEKVRDWEPLPAIVDCEKCGGVGLALHVCDICKGIGSLVVDDNFIRVCGECVGVATYTYPCGCEVRFGQSNYAQWYMNLIRELPEVRIGNVASGPERPLYFKFDGGVGCLMPLSDRR